MRWPFCSQWYQRHATFPPDWPKDEVPQIVDFDNGWPPDVQQKVLT